MSDAPPRIVLVPHTHWDREWYVPFETFRERLVQMMDGLIELLDGSTSFPHFHLDGQAAMIDDYLEVRPDREPALRRLAEAGRISVGPWYTQMDEFLVSGETSIRNLEWGLRRAEQLGGGPRIGYLPDQFGHIGQMPQILQNAGIDQAVVWRGVPGAVDRSSFWWEAPDGSSVLAEYLAFGYSVGAGLTGSETPEELAGTLRTAVRDVAPLCPRDRILLTVGGDHHVPAAGLPPLVDEVNRSTELRVELSSLQAFLAGPPPEGIPAWRGELRSSARAHLLPNVYSARADQKRDRARVEALVERYAEPTAALVPGVDWPERELERAWRLLLWNGAHDSACGCSADEVAEAVDARHAEARRLGEAVLGRAMRSLAGLVEPSGRLLFNPSPFEREGVPGLGWMVIPTGSARNGEEPVEVRIEGDRAVSGALSVGVVDEADVGDLYNFCPSNDGPPRGPDRLSVEDGTVHAAFEGTDVRFRIGRGAGDPFVRIEGEIDNRRPDHRLRLHVALRDEAAGSDALSPFEVVHRLIASEGSDLETGSPTWPARGAVVAGGTAVLSEGVIEYEVVEGRALAITLLRCVGTISRRSIPTRPWRAGPDVPTPLAQMRGRMPFAIGVQHGALPGDLARSWERFALPILEVDAPGGGRFPGHGRLLAIDGAELSSVRRIGPDVDVRVWNPAGEPVEATIGDRRIRLGPSRIETVRLPGYRYLG